MEQAAKMRQSTGGRMNGGHHGSPGLEGQRLDSPARLHRKHDRGGTRGAGGRARSRRRMRRG